MDGYRSDQDHLPSRAWCRCCHWDDRRAWSPWGWSWRGWPPRWWRHRAVASSHPAGLSGRRWRAAVSPSRQLCLEHHLCNCNCVSYFFCRCIFFFLVCVSINNAVFIVIVLLGLLVHKTREYWWWVVVVVFVFFGLYVASSGVIIVVVVIRYNGIRFSISIFRHTTNWVFWTQNPSVFFFISIYIFWYRFFFFAKN